MKNTSVAVIAAVIIFGVGIIVWSQRGEHANTAPVSAPVVAVAETDNEIAPAAGTVAPATPPAAAPVQPAVPPKVETPKEAPLSVAAEPAPEPAKPEEPVTTTIEEEEKRLDQITADQLRSSVETQFKGRLSFVMDEQKMIAFADASLRVRKINNKWDVQIAGATTDQMAIEYNNLAVEEITRSLSKIPGLTLEQYNEMTKLTSNDPEFNRVYQVYKQLVSEGYFKKDISNAAASAKASTATLAPETAAPAPTSKPAAEPVNPGTKPVTQGSTAPQYSPPVSR